MAGSGKPGRVAIGQSVDIRRAMLDPALFGQVFGAESFAAWRALLAGFYGLELGASELGNWTALTGRKAGPQTAHDELWLVIGRRGGKSHAAAFLAVFEAAFKDHRARLAAGEWATVMLLAADRSQARTLLRYVRGFFAHPLLRPLVTRETETTIELRTRTVIEVATASHKSVRGYTLAAAICDEIAFWNVDGSSPDAEILAALRPALATLGGPLIALSSPYARRGVLWGAYQGHYGQESRVLVAQAPSRLVNPTLPERVIAEALAADAERAKAEWLAEFRSDIASLIEPGLIEDATRPKPLELHRASGLRYRAFVDPSGGGADQFTLSIAHSDGGVAVVDLVRGLHGSPAASVAEFSGVLKAYGLTEVTGDRYAGRWPADEFRKHGISYRQSELDRSGLYLEFLARLNSGQVELPPDAALGRQLQALERRTGRSGRDMIDHPPGGHDDLANAVAGAVVLVSGVMLRGRAGVLFYDGAPVETKRPFEGLLGKVKI